MASKYNIDELIENVILNPELHRLRKTGQIWGRHHECDLFKQTSLISDYISLHWKEGDEDDVKFMYLIGLLHNIGKIYTRRRYKSGWIYPDYLSKGADPETLSIFIPADYEYFDSIRWFLYNQELPLSWVDDKSNNKIPKVKEMYPFANEKGYKSIHRMCTIKNLIRFVSCGMNALEWKATDQDLIGKLKVLE